MWFSDVYLFLIVYQQSTSQPASIDVWKMYISSETIQYCVKRHVFGTSWNCDVFPYSARDSLALLHTYKLVQGILKWYFTIGHINTYIHSYYRIQFYEYIYLFLILIKHHTKTKYGIDYIYKKTKTKYYKNERRKFARSAAIRTNQIILNQKYRISEISNCRKFFISRKIITKKQNQTSIGTKTKKTMIYYCIVSALKINLKNLKKNCCIRNVTVAVIKTVVTWFVFTIRQCKNLQVCALLILVYVQIDILYAYQNIKYSTNVIKTKYGPIRGIILKPSPVVEAFFGVPYASPPVGSLRYMPPVTPSTWKTTRLADSFSPVCPQSLPNMQIKSNKLLEMPRGRLQHLRRLLPLLFNQSEDCLYLNLYVPRSEDNVNPSGSPKATIVYIHGESYEWNSGNPYDGSVLAADGNVIFVTLNFRLGILGFLKTGAKGSAQGNFGLMDLVAALHWLRENLSFFHGDPSRITLMGHGTGAALANILAVSPVASDLIHRVVLLSGSALSPWAIQRDPMSLKQIVADQTSCRLDVLVDDLAPCLRTKSLSELLRISPESPRFLTAFAPFVDGTVIVNPNYSNIKFPRIPIGSAITSTQGLEFATFSKRELLFGLTSYESYDVLSAQDLEYGINETRRDRILRTYVRNVFHYHMKEIYSALRNEYTDWEHPPKNPLGHRDTILELLSDGYIAAPLVRLGYLHSLQEGQSYFLHFRHQTADRDFPQRGGSVHGEDVPFTFGLPFSPLFSANYSTDDTKVSRILVQYLTNFAKSGNPNGLSEFNINNLNKALVSPPNSNTRYKRSKPASDHPSDILNKLFLNGSIRNQPNENIQDSDYWYTPDKRSRQTGEPNGFLKDSEFIEKLDTWNMYDYVNQNYLELGKSGCNVVSKSHYRGHKLSMWLNLIPQLHSPEDAVYLPVRHHHFTDVKPDFFEGRLKSLSMTHSTKFITIGRTTVRPHKTESSITPLVQVSSTECPPNITVMTSVAATHPEHNTESIANISNRNLNSSINPQFQNYSTALNITIGVGFFLLLLNIIIFIATYYQREKHAKYDKSEANVLNECVDVNNKNESNDKPRTIAINMKHDNCKSKLQSGPNTTISSHYNISEHKSGNPQGKCILINVCKSDFSSRRNSTTGSTQRSITPDIQINDTGHENLSSMLSLNFPSRTSTGSDTSSDNTTTACHQYPKTKCIVDQSTQFDSTPKTHEIGTTVDEMELEFSSVLLDHPHSSRSVYYQGGILRQQTSSIIIGSSKKRVQIQEISV